MRDGRGQQLRADTLPAAVLGDHHVVAFRVVDAVTDDTRSGDQVAIGPDAERDHRVRQRLTDLADITVGPPAVLLVQSRQLGSIGGTEFDRFHTPPSASGNKSMSSARDDLARSGPPLRAGTGTHRV
nr:hypothetical protein [Haloglomus salinum]